MSRLFKRLSCCLYCRLLSPEPQRPRSLILENLPHLLGRPSPNGGTPLAQAPSPPSPAFNLIPELEEIRVSPCIARKGYLNVLEEKSKTWKRRFVNAHCACAV